MLSERRKSLGKETQSSPLSHCLSPGADIEFSVEIINMLFDRAFGNHQSGGNLLVGQAGGDQGQDFKLSGG